jgi:hypothetical protein
MNKPVPALSRNQQHPGRQQVMYNLEEQFL